MHIDTLLEQARTATAQTELFFPDHWGQGRTAFGGLTAAMLYSAIRPHIAPERVLRSLNTSFIGPLFADQPFTIQVEVLREGKHMAQVTARALQQGQTAVMTQACFGVERGSLINVDAQEHHQLATPEHGVPIPEQLGVTPAFLQHIQFSVQQGDMPFTGSSSSELGGWMRFKQAPKQLTDAHLICLIDAWPPTLLQQYPKPAPASTVSWNLEFIHPHSPLEADSWFGYKAHTRQAGAGYAHTEAGVWDEQGELVAISRQVVALFV